MIVVALVINLIIVIGELVVLYHIKGKKNIFKYYTYLQNFISLLVSLIFAFWISWCLITENTIPEFIRGLRYIATCGLLATMFIFIVFLNRGKKVAITKDDFLFGFNHKIANILLHYIFPILSLISFCIFEREITLENGIWTLLVAIPSCLYWIIYFILSATKLWEEPYDFTSKNKLWEILSFVLIPLSFVLISIILWNIK